MEIRLSARVRKSLEAVHSISLSARSFLGRYRAFLSSAALAIITAAAFLLRFAAYDHPLHLYGGDGFRDYLLASHAIQFGEWPLTGPPHFAANAIFASPVYVYLLALPLLIFDSVEFLNVFHLLLQSGGIIALYFLGRRLFGSSAALIGTGLFALSPHLIQQGATFIWPAIVVQPFVIFSMLALAIGYQDRTPRYLLLSALLMVLSVALYLPVEGMVPLFAALHVYATRSVSGTKGVLQSLFASLILFLLLFIGPIIAFKPADFFFTPSVRHSLLSSIETMVVYIDRAFSFSSRIFNDVDIFRIALVFTIPYMLSRAVATPRKRWMLIVALFIGLQGLWIIFLGASERSRYLYPVLWAAALLIASVAWESLSRSAWGRTAFVVIAAVIAFGWTHHRVVTRAIDNIPAFFRPTVALVESMSDAIVHEVEKLRTSGRYDDDHFFDIRIYMQRDGGADASTLWAPLERRLGKLTRIDPTQPGTLIPLGSRDVLFVACLKTVSFDEDRCAAHIDTSIPEYRRIERIFSSATTTVFVATKR